MHPLCGVPLVTTDDAEDTTELSNYCRTLPPRRHQMEGYLKVAMDAKAFERNMICYMLYVSAVSVMQSATGLCLHSLITE